MNIKEPIKSSSKGFTLIELLIVVAIIGILAAVGAAVIPGLLTNAKIKCATANHHEMWNTLKIKVTACSAGMDVTYGPLYNRKPDTVILECSKNTTGPSGNHYYSADSHAYNLYLEGKQSMKSCYDTTISAFGGGPPGGHGWSAGAGWSNGTCNIPDKGIDLGQSVLGYNGNPYLCGGHGGDKACLKTNVGDRDGNDEFLYNIIDICELN